MELLLANKAEVNTKDYHGQTPLHSAVGWCRKDKTAEMLLASKAKIDVKDDRGRTPFALGSV